MVQYNPTVEIHPPSPSPRRRQTETAAEEHSDDVAPVGDQAPLYMVYDGAPMAPEDTLMLVEDAKDAGTALPGGCTTERYMDLMPTAIQSGSMAMHVELQQLTIQQKEREVVLLRAAEAAGDQRRQVAKVKNMVHQVIQEDEVRVAAIAAQEAIAASKQAELVKASLLMEKKPSGPLMMMESKSSRSLDAPRTPERVGPVAAGKRQRVSKPMVRGPSLVPLATKSFPDVTISSRMHTEEHPPAAHVPLVRPAHQPEVMHAASLELDLSSDLSGAPMHRLQPIESAPLAAPPAARMPSSTHLANARNLKPLPIVPASKALRSAPSGGDGVGAKRNLPAIGIGMTMMDFGGSAQVPGATRERSNAQLPRLNQHGNAQAAMGSNKGPGGGIAAQSARASQSKVGPMGSPMTPSGARGNDSPSSSLTGALAAASAAAMRTGRGPKVEESHALPPIPLGRVR